MLTKPSLTSRQQALIGQLVFLRIQSSQVYSYLLKEIGDISKKPYPDTNFTQLKRHLKEIAQTKPFLFPIATAINEYVNWDIFYKDLRAVLPSVNPDNNLLLPSLYKTAKNNHPLLLQHLTDYMGKAKTAIRSSATLSTKKSKWEVVKVHIRRYGDHNPAIKVLCDAILNYGDDYQTFLTHWDKL